MREFEGVWGRSTEHDMAIREDELAGSRELLIGVQPYVNETLKNTKVVESLIGQNMPNIVGSEAAAAHKFARQNPFIIPADIRDESDDFKTMYVLALAEALRRKIQ